MVTGVCADTKYLCTLPFGTCIAIIFPRKLIQKLFNTEEYIFPFGDRTGKTVFFFYKYRPEIGDNALGYKYFVDGMKKY